MNGHVDWATLVALLEGAETDRVAETHLRDCIACQAEQAEVKRIVGLLQDGDVAQYAQEMADDRDRASLRAALVASNDHRAREEAEADERFAILIRHPIAAWDSIIVADDRFATNALMQRIVGEAERTLDSAPAMALRLLEVAERWTLAHDAPARLLFGNIWKHRSNALRAHGPLPESLEAAELAEVFYTSVPNSDFEIGQARYTYAAALVQMTRNDEALRVLAEAEALLRRFGSTVPLVKTAMLRATILFQTGHTAEAEARWRDLIPTLEQLGDRKELARLRASLAECARVRGAYEEALADAHDAIAMYRALHMETECVRSAWTIGMIHVNSGESMQGLEELDAAAREFVALEMTADAGYVKLDIVEELLRQQEWTSAASIARELVDLFRRAGVTFGSIEALTYLRTAVEQERATVPLVQYVRDFVTADDLMLSFAPPQ